MLENIQIGETNIGLITGFNEIVKEDFDIVDRIGFIGPLILFSINIVKLWNQKPYLGGYLIFVFLNSIVNHVLKITIKEERPMQNGISIRNKKDGYGMPSAHAQSAMFSVIYLFLVKRSYSWLLIGLFITLLTLYQRWKTKMHTIKQLIIGSLIGFIFSLFGYYLSYSWIKSGSIL